MPEIKIETDGFKAIFTDRSIKVVWREVKRVFVYKKDLLTYDLICSAFELTNGETIHFDEDFEDWLELMTTITKHLPECMPFADWYLDVAFPAFEENPELIYERTN